MLQNYDNRNNSVTNGESGAKLYIVSSGDQKRHAPHRPIPVHVHSILRTPAYYMRRRAGKLEASWKQAGIKTN